MAQGRHRAPQRDTQRLQEEKPKGSAEFVSKADLKRILMQSLDPLSAQRAIEAIDVTGGPPPHNQQSITNNYLQQIPSFQQPKGSTKRSRRRMLVQQPLRLPSMTDSISLTADDARLIGGNYAVNPLSVRSTVSEPTVSYGKTHNRAQDLYPDIQRGHDGKVDHFMVSVHNNRRDSRNVDVSSLDARLNGAKTVKSQLPALYVKPSHGDDQKSLRAHQPSTQSTYDSSSVVNMLRLERTMRPAHNISSEPSQQGVYRRFWGWKDNSGNSNGKSIHVNMAARDLELNHSQPKRTENADQNQIIRSDQISSKIGKIKQMQDIYKSGNGRDDFAPTRSWSIEDQEKKLESPLQGVVDKPGVVSSSPPYKPLGQVHHHISPKIAQKAPRTPKITDIDLTDTDLSAISKYFEQPQFLHPAIEAVRTEKVSSPEIQSPHHVYGAHGVQNKVLQRPISSNFDVLGDESLIMWTKSLDVKDL